MARHNTDGRLAEEKTAEYLREQGFEIIDVNWKTKWCEIDIVAKKAKTIHFVEVKYRGNNAQGSGFDYITESKLQKMRLAADSWVELNNWSGQYVLSAAEVSGAYFNVELIEEI